MTISSDTDLAAMRRVGRLVARTLEQMRAAVRPGNTTGEIDRVAERFARAAGARSAPQLAYDFPGFTCISVNDEIVHGIPGPRIIQPGDMVKLDVTLELDGYMADAAATVLVPPVSPEARRLQRTARVIEAADGWTLRTHNRALAAHHEHTIVIRRGTPLVLTAA